MALMRENHAYLRGAGHWRRISSLNIQHRTSDIQHPIPDDATRRKGRREPTWISLTAQKWGFEGGYGTKVCPRWYQAAPRPARGRRGRRVVFGILMVDTEP